MSDMSDATDMSSDMSVSCISTFATESEYQEDLLFDGESEESAENRELATILWAVVTVSYSQRGNYHVRDRLEWVEHVDQLEMEGRHAFYCLYRMEHRSFRKLCVLIDPIVSVDPVMSEIRTKKSPIITEIALHCLLRWLAGGSYLDIRLSAGISVSSFYVCVYKCVDAINSCDELSYHFPRQPSQIESSSREFQMLSTNGALDGCVGCLDGLLLKIITPPATDTGNVKAYFSGHYQCYGINIQAVCDANCRFSYVAVAAPGSTFDATAYSKTSLSYFVEKLPVGKYIIGDNAYTCTEHLLTPFAGSHREDPKKDSYNFFVSQLRIRVEMTFGRFVNKWRIFKRSLHIRLKNVGKVFICATRLHNFCMDEADKDNWSVLSVRDQDEEEVFLESDPETVSIPGNSLTREWVLTEIYNMGLDRPANNLRRNLRYGTL